MTDGRFLQRATVVLCLCVGLLAWGRAPQQATPEFDAKRDELIEQLLAGQDTAQATAQFKALLAARDAVVATSFAAKTAADAAAAAKRSWQRRFAAEADSLVASGCKLSVKPDSQGDPNRRVADWGRVVRTATVTVPGRHPMDPDEHVTLYEVAATAQHLAFRADRFAERDLPPFKASVGDLVLVCWFGAPDATFDGSWKGLVRSNAFAVRINQPPLIVKKAAWNPVPVTSTDVFWLVRAAKWKVPADRYALMAAEVVSVRSPTEFDIDAEQGQRAVLEVPPVVRKGLVLEPGRTVWAIVKAPVIDTVAKQVRFTAVDVEGEYIDEADEVVRP